MVVIPYSNEELWNPDPYQLPKRSRLNHILPVSVGSPFVESLTSYLTRLAQSHSTTISILMTREFAPLLDKHYIQNGSKKGLSTLFNRSAAINSTGELAKLLVDSVEKLTLKQNLSALTLLPFRNCLSSRELLHKTKAWCPDCYEEWRASKKTIYDPLLWNLKDVELCSNHHRLLQTVCFHCDRSIPWLHSKSRIGYCPYCDRWLGSSSETTNTTNLLLSQKNLRRNIWISKTLGELIACSEEDAFVIQKDNIAKAIRQTIKITHQGNIASFAQSFKLPKNTVWMWHQGNSIPKLKYILNICYCLDIPLLSFLKLESTVFESLEIDFQKLPNKGGVKRVSPKNFNPQKIENALQKILKSQHIPPTTMKEVAKQIGFDRRIISEYYPELCKAISAKYRRYQDRVRAKKIEECCQEVRQAVSVLYQRGEYPSEVRVSQLISQPGYFRYKKVRMALKDAKSEIHF